MQSVIERSCRFCHEAYKPCEECGFAMLCKCEEGKHHCDFYVCTECGHSELSHEKTQYDWRCKKEGCKCSSLK